MLETVDEDEAIFYNKADYFILKYNIKNKAHVLILGFCLFTIMEYCVTWNFRSGYQQETLDAGRGYRAD